MFGKFLKTQLKPDQQHLRGGEAMAAGFWNFAQTEQGAGLVGNSMSSNDEYRERKQLLKKAGPGGRKGKTKPNGKYRGSTGSRSATQTRQADTSRDSTFSSYRGGNPSGSRPRSFFS